MALFSVLDEATSALDVASETKLYLKCKQLDITVVSVAHRDSLWKVSLAIIVNNR